MSGASDAGESARTVSAKRDYADAVKSFDLSADLATLSMDSAGHVNAAEICCDRHLAGNGIALRHRSPSGVTRDWTFAELRQKSAQFAEVLADLGVGKGDRVAGLLPRTPELLITMLAAWRLGAVYQPLFTAFGPKAIEHRTGEGRTKVIVTDRVNRGKLAEAAVSATIVTVGGGAAGDRDFWPETERRDGNVASVGCSLDDPFLLMFTSGTTGLPKPLLVSLRAIAAFKNYMRDAVGLQSTDRFWNLADPGWAYGLYYGLIGPLALGVTTVLNEGSFTAEATYDTIAEYEINNLAGSPTAFRILMGEGAEQAAPIKGLLRVVSSAGEPLNPELIRWFDRHLDAPIHDHYGQTELGMVLCNHHSLDHPIRMGAAGYASPGHRVVILAADGTEMSAGTPGILALDTSRSPMMWFAGYAERETHAFQGSYFLTGDTAELNEDGSISFVGREDDVITTSGYRVGPFDVESALLEHEAVLESAVIGVPDPDRTEIIKAFVVLKPGVSPSVELTETLRRHVKQRLSAHAYPREIEFAEALPKTPSGKVQRFLLRRQEADRRAPRTRVE